MATYLSNDWGRDWGSLRKFDTIVEEIRASLESLRRSAFFTGN